jgi:subtilisin family serine protease
MRKLAMRKLAMRKLAMRKLAMRKLAIGVILALVCSLAAVAVPGGSGAAQSADEHEFVVLYTEGAPLAEARAAVEAAGGSIVRENTAVGVATVRTADPDFIASVAEQPALVGAAHNRIIGAVPQPTSARDAAEKIDRAETDLRRIEAGGVHPPPHPPAVIDDPLSSLQWNMQQIGATSGGSYGVERGSRRVLVGIIDTGIDGSHPDIAPNFDARLSRNFTVDIEVDANGQPIDGLCSEEPDQSCEDPADVDEDGHGTHVASIIGSPLNGLGIAGVAPEVRLVNLRAGQDSGYFFLQPTVDALTYAGDNGVDVVNMSYFVDPWLYNCVDNPADSPENRVEQQTIREAVQRALRYARKRGVTLVAAAGNEGTDVTKPTIDEISPDFADTPGEAPYPREIDPETCDVMPTEGKGVLAISATGISERKAYYSSHGNGFVDLAAPGGDAFDTPDNTPDISKLVLAAYPESVAIALGDLDDDGEPVTPFVVRDCTPDGVCAYYQYLQGSSMASPHAAGVAALVVSRYGHRDVHGRGRTLDPDEVESVMRTSATDTACPDPPGFEYTLVFPLPDGGVETEMLTATCEGEPGNNGFFGDGIVDAARAVEHHG